MSKQGKQFFSLLPLEEFKSLAGIDDREDRLARFCLVTATLTIEQYCKRRLSRKKHFELIKFTGDLIVPFREYPVSKVLAVFLIGNGEILEPDFYSSIPDCGTGEDLPFNLSLSPALLRYRKLNALKIVYWAGYALNDIPPDLSSACFELASWNLNRYRGKRIGMTGSVRKEGEHFEMSMPQNVRVLLEPYRRKTI
jgi:hypothetical protein